MFIKLTIFQSDLTKFGGIYITFFGVFECTDISIVRLVPVNSDLKEFHWVRSERRGECNLLPSYQGFTPATCAVSILLSCVELLLSYPPCPLEVTANREIRPGAVGESVTASKMK